MEAPVRILSRNLLIKSNFLKPPTCRRSITPHHQKHIISATTTPLSSYGVHSSHFPIFPSPNPTNPINFLLSLSSQHLSSTPLNPNTTSHAPFQSNTNDSVFSWHRAPAPPIHPNATALGSKSPVVTVVLLGWLGARQKHLKKYVEWYNSQGIHAVTFVVDMRELLSLDPVKNVEKRLTALADEIIYWVSGSEEDGRGRCLIFHTFSNTGWLVYGYILDIMRRKEGLMEKIKGCVADSGGAGLLDPKVWAAGFSAAFLKRHSSAVLPALEINKISELSQANEEEMQEKRTPMLEAMLLSMLEKIFSVVLKLPDVDQKLQTVVSTLSKNQPPCPQLFLYSTADKLVPYQSIESLIKEHRSKGRKVLSHNFVASPHVDHYRSFPDAYVSLLRAFLKECFPVVKQA